MPQVLILIAAGAGLVLAMRWLRQEQGRIAAELKAAKKAMEQHEAERTVPLERDPSTGIYHPKRGHRAQH
ncbi:MAG: hypothetical protein ACREDO_13980 [Methyloceanibacter sp.]